MNTHSLARAFASILLAAASTTLCAAAFAGDADALPQRRVSFADLNLNHPEGVKVLYSRLRSAARAVCSTSSTMPYDLRGQSRKCAEVAMQDAVAQINNSNLTAYYNEKTNKTVRGDTKVASER